MVGALLVDRRLAVDSEEGGITVGRWPAQLLVYGERGVLVCSRDDDGARYEGGSAKCRPIG